MENKIFEEVNKIEGFFDKAEMENLYPLVKGLSKESLLVEIGTFHGRSTKFFSLTNPDIKIFTVDAGIGGSIYDSVLKSGNIVQVIGGSWEVVKTFNWKVDFLFIDGDHLYTGIKGDIERWTPFVKLGGYVAFHDYHSTDKRWGGVTKAVDEWMENNKEFKKVSNDNVTNLFIAQKYD